MLEPELRKLATDKCLTLAAYFYLHINEIDKAMDIFDEIRGKNQFTESCKAWVLLA